MFKKIYDLKVKEVEGFIRNLVIKRYYGGHFDKDKYIDIRWCPDDRDFGDTFYVYTKPKMEPGPDDSYTYYKGKKITYQEYLNIIMCHWHISMRAIYAYMTGETLLVEKPCEHDDYVRFEIVHNKEDYDIRYNKETKEWYMSTWVKNGEDYIEIKKPVLNEIIEYMKNEESILEII